MEESFIDVSEDLLPSLFNVILDNMFSGIWTGVDIYKYKERFFRLGIDDDNDIYIEIIN